jgi:hypothetical protein
MPIRGVAIIQTQQRDSIPVGPGISFYSMPEFISRYLAQLLKQHMQFRYASGIQTFLHYFCPGYYNNLRGGAI